MSIAVPTRTGRWPSVARIASLLARVLLVIYALLVVAAYLGQEALLFPGRTTQGTARAKVWLPKHAELVSFALANGTQLSALFALALEGDVPTPAPRKRPTVIFFYGNGSCLADSVELVQSLRRRGANVLVADYPGYGLSGGQAGEAAFYAAADSLYEYALTRPEVDPARLVSMGFSMGGGVAVELARRHPVAGLVLLSTFTSLVDVAGGIAWFLPTSWIVRHRFDSLSKIGELRMPMLIGHGATDDFVPTAMGRSLRDRAVAGGAPERVRYFEVPEADHFDLFVRGQAQIWGEIERFLSAL